MADRIKGLSIDLDLETTRVERGLTGLKDRLKTVNSEMKSNMSAFERSDRSIGKYETRLKGLNKKIEVQSKITEESSRKYKEMVKQHGEGSKQAEKASQEYNKQAAELNNLQSYTKGVRQELEKLQEEQRLSNSKWTKMGDRLDKTGKKLGSIGKGAQSFGKKWTAGMGVAGGAVAGLGASLFALTEKATGAADAIAKGSERAGVSTKYYQEMTFWASQNGIAHGQMEKGLGRLNQRLGLAAEGNKKYAGALERLGIDMNEVKKGTISTEDAFGQSISTLSEMTNEQKKAELATELFGVKLARDLLPALNDGSLSIEEAKKQAEQLGLVMSEDQLFAAESFQDSWDKIQRSLSAAGMKIGLELMPKFQQMLDFILANMPQIRETIGKAFDQVIERVSATVKWWRELSDGAKRWIGIAAAVATAIGPMAIAFGTVLRVAGPFVSLFGKIHKWVGKVGGLLPALKLAFAALTGPIGLTIGAIAALVTGFTIAYKKSETFRGIVHKVKEAFIQTYQKIKEFLTTNPKFLAFIDSVKSGFVKAKDIIMQGFGLAMDFVREKIGQVKEFWASDGQQLLQAFQNIFSGIWAVVKPIIDGLVSAFQWAFPHMKTIFSVAFKIVLSIAKSIIGNIKGIIDGGLNFILGIAKTFSGLFTGDFSKMWEGIKQMFAGAIQFVWNFVQLTFFGKLLKGVGVFAKSFGGFFKSLWTNIKNIFTTVITSIWNFFKNRFTSLLNTGKSIFSGLRDSAKVIWNATKNNIVNPIKNAYTSTTKRIGNLRDKGVEIFRNMRDKVKDVFENMVTAIKNLPGRMRDGLKDNASKIASGVKQVSKFLLEGLAKGVNGVGGGINWILDKVHAPKKLRIPKWKIPAYEKGTDNHPGGLAVVSDSKGQHKQELIRLPQGDLFLSPKKETIMDLPKGTSVLDGNSTSELLKGTGIPAYADGKGILQKAWGGIKSLGSKVKNTAASVWEFAKDPLSLIKSAISSFTNLKSVGQPAKGIAKGMISKVTSGAKGWIKGLIEGGSFMGSGDVPGNVKSWISQAIARTGVLSSWLGALTTIAMKESGGRTGPSTINKWDSNWRRGTPSMGLMQTIRPTFNAYKETGWNDIMNPVHNAAAAINYIKSRYGNVVNVPGIRGLRNGTGYVGYKTGARISTPGLYGFAEDGWPEYAISTNPARRTDSMKLLALAGKEIQGNKRPNQLPTPGNDGFSEASLQVIIEKLEKQVANTEEMVQLLMKLLLKDPNFVVDGRSLAIAAKPHLDDMQKLNRERGDEFA